ncbi:MAG: MotA/TolQ/ExbB proton channel family protein [Halobacteriovoraceae bacterium]|nr:MotA/TolQ/ExbB proton channel family protein [Halobacteriovoraceae bacterium]
MRIIDYINQGGPIMYILLLLNILGFALMISKLLTLNREKKDISRITDDLKKNIEESGRDNKDSNILIELSKRELSSYMEGMEKGLNTVKIIASISPLLGLLGTVIGVLIAFKVMAEGGLNNPSLFAEGISMALITTVGGMIVAIPHYVGHNYLLGMLDNLETSLEKDLVGKVL